MGRQSARTVGRANLFRSFSQNLEWVKEHASIKFEPDFEYGYICPLCFRLFLEKDLDTSLSNFLTFEDIPPKSLGGRPRALTCNACNSRSGHELDAHLLKTLLDTDAQNFLPNSSANVTYQLSGNSINGTFKVSSDGVVTLKMEKTRSHPIQAEKFLNELIPRTRISKPYPPLFRPLQDAAPNPAFSMTVSKIFDTRRANIALLRIGYLLAFATLGNSFLLNSGLFTVREQLMHPDKEVIKIFWIAHKFPKHMEGIHIITLPKDMRAFLVIFSLATRSSTSQFAIVLPGPTAPGIKVYDFIESELCTGDGTTFLNFTTEKLPDKNYLKDKASAFLAQAYWQEFTNDGYTPRFAP